MGYAFISYSSKDQQLADATRQTLIESGIEIWMAPYDIPAGSKYAYVINDAIEKSACLVLLLTEDALDDEQIDAYFRAPFVWATQETLKKPAD